MSLTISRSPTDSFVLIDANDPESFVVVTIADISGNQAKVRIDAPANVHILRREILNRYPEHKEVIAAIERMEAARPQFSQPSKE
jgi:sRNA-binding carbon storage regulator CsrA